MFKIIKKSVSRARTFTPARARKAESLLEVIMALFVVALGSAAATSLVVNAMMSNGYSRDNLIALNLAVEGVESIRNVRDSNWLKFGFNKSGCWNERPEQASCAGQVIGDGSYTVSLDTTIMKWVMTALVTPLSNSLSTPITDDPYKLYYRDLHAATDTNGDGNLTNDPDIYIDAESALGAGGNSGTSKFYRMITIDYEGIDPAIATEMTVTSLVLWQNSGGVSMVNLQSKLTNYQKIKVT